MLWGTVTGNKEVASFIEMGASPQTPRFNALWPESLGYNICT